MRWPASNRRSDLSHVHLLAQTLILALTPALTLISRAAREAHLTRT